MNKDNYYLLDTNSFKIFNNFDFNKDELEGWKFFCTSVQMIEIEQYKNVERRKLLLDVFNKITPEMVVSPAGYYSLFKYGFGRYPTPENAMILDSLKQEIMERDLINEAKGNKKKSGKNPSDREMNLGADAMILQAAIMLGPRCFVVTTDKSMKEVCSSNKRVNKIKNASPSTLLRKIKNKQ